MPANVMRINVSELLGHPTQEPEQAARLVVAFRLLSAERSDRVNGAR